jgi:hypothetical protein
VNWAGIAPFWPNEGDARRNAPAPVVGFAEAVGLFAGPDGLAEAREPEAAGGPAPGDPEGAADRVWKGEEDAELEHPASSTTTSVRGRAAAARTADGERPTHGTSSGC